MSIKHILGENIYLKLQNLTVFNFVWFELSTKLQLLLKFS